MESVVVDPGAWIWRVAAEELLQVPGVPYCSPVVVDVDGRAGANRWKYRWASFSSLSSQSGRSCVGGMSIVSSLSKSTGLPLLGAPTQEGLEQLFDGVDATAASMGGGLQLAL